MVLDNVGAVLGNLVPVDDVPPGADVFRSTVLVFQVVSVLPNIQTKDWELDLIADTLHERIVLVRSSCMKKGTKKEDNSLLVEETGCIVKK